MSCCRCRPTGLFAILDMRKVKPRQHLRKVGDVIGVGSQYNSCRHCIGYRTVNNWPIL